MIRAFIACRQVIMRAAGKTAFVQYCSDHVAPLGSQSTSIMKVWTLMAMLASAGCAPLASPNAQAPRPTTKYIAMGSSFAAGPGITTSADVPANRCSRSTDNYAHQLARMRHFDLVDVSCSGATTEHILGPWAELPAQIDAVTPDTALVTITIGGNDVGYIGKLFMSSCSGMATGTLETRAAALCKRLTQNRPAADPAAQSRASAPPTDAQWIALGASLRRISEDVRRRAPRAHIVYVDYVTLLPDGAPCAEVPLSPDDAANARAIAARLANITASAADASHATLVKASRLSAGHDACAAEPWVSGFLPREGMPGSAIYHPNERAMRAIANAIDKRLGK
jgi:lysophospholipase L1-like esterase